MTNGIEKELTAELFPVIVGRVIAAFGMVAGWNSGQSFGIEVRRQAECTCINLGRLVG